MRAAVAPLVHLLAHVESAAMDRADAITKAQPSHWIDYDAPARRGRAQASCGSVVDTTTFA